MITLPDWAVPNDIRPSFVDAGATVRSGLTRAGTRIDRLGGHFAAEISFPPFEAGQGAIVLSRLLRATSEGLRVEWPLLGIDQGAPGSPVVDGAGQGGTTLALRGLTPHWAAREGWWLTLVTGGQYYLYNVADNAAADASGDLSLPIWPELRAPPADGDTALLGRPAIEGAIDDDRIAWEMSLAHHLYLTVRIEELA